MYYTFSILSISIRIFALNFLSNFFILSEKVATWLKLLKYFKSFNFRSKILSLTEYFHTTLALQSSHGDNFAAYFNNNRPYYHRYLSSIQRNRDRNNFHRIEFPQNTIVVMLSWKCRRQVIATLLLYYVNIPFGKNCHIHCNSTFKFSSRSSMIDMQMVKDIDKNVKFVFAYHLFDF